MAEIAITRVFDAPREQIWKAWTEPERLARWWGKRGWNAVPSTITLDVRPGGRFALTSVSEADGSELSHNAVFREVVEPERLVWGDERAVATVTFADLGDGRTEMSFHTTVDTTPETRDRAEGGLESAFDRLAESLEEER
jgi:uncharacterized protein YndB with AHSA1/START domain